jgi:hypothetical protein
MKGILSILLILFSLQVFCQNSNLVIHQSADIEKLLEKHVKVNEIQNWVNGYRVQINSVGGANSKEKANAIKAEILTKYPDAIVYVIYQAPYFKVRIGNFRTQLDALAYLQQIKLGYPFAFVVIDEIEIPKTE